MGIGDASSLLNAIPDVWKYAEQQGWVNSTAQQAQQAQQAQLAQAMQNSPIMQLPPIMQYDPATQRVRAVDSPINPHHRARELFQMRMGGVRKEFKLSHLDFIQCHVENDMVHLFYCFGGKTGVASEQADMFPSDQLIAQFRMVLA